MRKSWLLLASGLLLLFMPVARLAAQNERQPEVVIVHTIGKDKENGYDLTIFLTVRDEQGRPVPANRISQASIQITGQPDQPADLRDPDSPIKLALLLDASGSMRPVIESVRQSAIDAVDRAPVGAEIGVWTFSQLGDDDDFSPGVAFTTDRAVVKDYIRSQYDPQSGAPTCLFNAAYRLTGVLQETLSPVDRRAIVLFTDGRDAQANSAAPCSNHTLSDVMDRVLDDRSPQTPIYTLGLCSDNPCSNLDNTVMERIARQSNALFASGTLNQLTERFFQIMDDIKSQKVIQAFITPCKNSQGTLLLKVLNMQQEDLAGTFRIASDKCYFPRATAKVENVRRSERAYDFGVPITNDSPVQLQRVDMNVLGPDNTSVYTATVAQQIDSRASATVPISIPFLSLTASGKYVVQIKAISEDQVFFQSSTNDKSKDVIATYEFAHEALDAVTLEIVSAPFIDYTDDLLRVDELNVVDEREQLKGNEKFLKYQIFLLDGDTRVFESREYDFDLDNPKIAVPLKDISGDVLPQAAIKRYNLQIRLISPNNSPVLSQPFAFDFPPRKVPGFFSRYGMLMLGILLVIALSAFLWRWLRTRPFRRKNIPPPQPYTAPTGMLVDRRLSPVGAAASAAAPPPAPKLHVRVISTPESSQKRNQLAEKFPYVIGRAESDFNIAGDKLLSRGHATIDYGPGGFTITDTSRNGVFINDQRLSPNTPTPLRGHTVVRLGQWTNLEIEPA